MSKIKIDTPSIMFTALTTNNWGRTFGYSARLKNGDIDPELMKEACDRIAPEFPYMFTNLRRGIFWNYQIPSGTVPNIYEKERSAIKPIGFRYDGKPDFRLTYSGNRIAFESAHCLGDGKGLLRFFEAMIVEYSRLKAGNTSAEIPDSGDKEGKCENSFDRYYDKKAPVGKEALANAYHLPYKDEKGLLELTFAKMTVEDVKREAHAYSMTVTEYLTAVLILGIIRAEEKPITKPVTIYVPVDLRRFFPSTTTRNFVAQAAVPFNPEGRRDWTLEEVISATAGQLKHRANKETLQKIINSYGKLTHSPVINAVPNIVKIPVMKVIQKVSHNKATTIFTNVGDVKMPEELGDIVYDLRFINGDTRAYNLVSTVSCASVGGELTLCWSQVMRNKDWLNECVKILEENNIKVSFAD